MNSFIKYTLCCDATLFDIWPDACPIVSVQISSRVSFQQRLKLFNDRSISLIFAVTVVECTIAYQWVSLPWQCLCPPQSSDVTWSWAPPPPHCEWRASSSSSTVSLEVYASDASRKTPYCFAISGYPVNLENAICDKFTKSR